MPGTTVILATQKWQCPGSACADKECFRHVDNPCSTHLTFPSLSFCNRGQFCPSRQVGLTAQLCTLTGNCQIKKAGIPLWRKSALVGCRLSLLLPPGLQNFYPLLGSCTNLKPCQNTTNNKRK